MAGPTALAVSRAIGDILMKEPRKLVIADAETRCFDLSPQVCTRFLCERMRQILAVCCRYLGGWVGLEAAVAVDARCVGIVTVGAPRAAEPRPRT